MSVPTGWRRHAHDCPGCGGPDVPRERYACRPCWRRLPFEYRDRIMVTWRACTANPTSTLAVLAHESAKDAAKGWYAIHNGQ